MGGERSGGERVGVERGGGERPSSCAERRESHAMLQRTNEAWDARAWVENSYRSQGARKRWGFRSMQMPKAVVMVFVGLGGRRSLVPLTEPFGGLGVVAVAGEVVGVVVVEEGDAMDIEVLGGEGGEVGTAGLIEGGGITEGLDIGGVEWRGSGSSVLSHPDGDGSAHFSSV